MSLNLHKLSFELAETLAQRWFAFCHAYERPECIDIGPTAEDAFMLSAAADGLIAGGGAEINRELSESNHWMLRWRKFGYPTFQLTHSLAASLMLTDCSAVSGGDFRFPFPSFLINMPYPNSPISIDGERGSSGVRWIVAHQMRYPIPEDSPKLVDRLGAQGWIHKAPSDIRWMPCTMVRLIEPYGVGVFERKPLPDDDDTLESWLMTGIPIEAVHHLPSTSLDSAAARAALRLVANLSLYLDAQRQEGHDLPERRIRNPKKKKSHRRPRDIGPALPPAWILGQGIKLDPELRAAASQVARPEGQQRAEWKLQSQHVVRGHWKMQAYGPKRSLRRKIRVEPYWRGPRLSEAVLRSFTE